MSPFTAKHLVQSAEISTNDTLERVFELLCPTREHDWVEGWEASVLHSESGHAELGCVFTTNLGRPETWIVCRYEPPHRVGFARVGELLAIDLSIDLRRETGKTVSRWTYASTALCPAGNQYLDSQTATEFDSKIDSLACSLEHYLSTGEMLRTSPAPGPSA